MTTVPWTFTDRRGNALAVGDRVLPTCWGAEVPLFLCNTRATVVGFGRTKVKVQFDSYSYDVPPERCSAGYREFHSVPPSWLRKV
jgi:hypothetical protein